MVVENLDAADAQSPNESAVKKLRLDSKAFAHSIASNARKQSEAEQLQTASESTGETVSADAGAAASESTVGVGSG
jgi:hypothetical protein